MKPILILISLLLNNLIYSNIYCIDHSVNTVINILTPKKTNLKAYSNTPFRYQGQYEDIETGLYYNRFRYYSPDTGTYISQDPIGLLGNNPNFYAYVHDVNSWVDVFGLDTFYQLFNDSGDLVYEGITKRNIQDRLTEHASDGKFFSQVKYVDDLDSKAASRNIEGSSLFHNKNNSKQLNKRRLDGGFYHSYDPGNIKDGRKFLSQAEIDAKMKNAKVSDVDIKGKIKCH
ncbi:RHS repeat-associated core domain-containing protein [Tenacibaculum maritimum]|uniref:RHS repeat-associated core domain-containing protein n=1 Tax=Tenacibaculum maritimum TaxID=107401 RepID=UPI0012E57A39|nr:RHS repeat-associated core domain-containing protein [Tenacibaculum maritimum]CAA0263115.1 hypothetical protein USCSE301_950004 [Tenacibaculum maritimum]